MEKHTLFLFLSFHKIIALEDQNTFLIKLVDSVQSQFLHSVLQYLSFYYYFTSKEIKILFLFNLSGVFPEFLTDV